MASKTSGPRGLISWDRLVSAGGLLGIAHETLTAGPERPYLLAVFVVMLGLPLPAGIDRWLRSRGDKQP